MAVKKKMNEDVIVDVPVNVPEVENKTDITVEIAEKTEKMEEKDTVTVDTTKVNNVKVRMRVDHKCTIAMKRYDLKAGHTYTVPKNVKNILNKAGLLSPL